MTEGNIDQQSRNLDKAQISELEQLDPSSIRKGTGLGQSEFASLMGMGEKGYRDWEDGIGWPGQPAQRLLYLIKSDPQNITTMLGRL